MRQKSIYRGVLIVAGLMAAAIIVLSHSISINQLATKKTATEQTDEKSEQKAELQVPAEAVTQGTTVQIDEQVPETLIETISTTEENNKFIPSTEKLLSNFFRVLFQSVIAPNAP